MKNMIMFLALLSGAAQAISYEQIKTEILVPKCVACHSAEHPTRGVDLSSYEGVLAAIVPGSSAQSALYQAVTTTDGILMPPSGPALSRKELRDIKKWIDGGAPLEE